MTNTWFRTATLAVLCLAAAPMAARAQTDSVLAVIKNNTTLMRVNSNGKVGIGTSTPDRTLTVNGSIGADSVVATYGFKFPDGTVQVTAAANNNSGTSSNTPNTLVKRDSVGGFAAGKVTLDSLSVAGRSALGTTNVSGRLTVADSLTVSAGVRFGDGSVQTTAATSATGTSVNTPSTLVQRDAIGGFSAGKILLDSIAVSGRSALGTTDVSGKLTVADSLTVSAGVRFGDGSVQTTAAASATGTSANTPSTLVQRDANGGFAAGKATLDSLTVSGRTLVTGKVTVTDSLTASAGVRFGDGSVQTTAASSGTSVNTASTLVARDASGNFAAGTVTLRQLTISDNEANQGASARIQIKSGSNLGDRFVVDSAGGVAAMGSLGIGIILKEGSGERMIWHPYRASFRAGGVSGDQWNDANMGFYSAAFGQNVQAEGNWSIAAGHSSFTDQPYSVALGFRAHADGTAAIAMGYQATANAQYSIALGRSVSTMGYSGAIVIGDGSLIGSDSLQATADNQFSLRAAGGIRLYTNTAKTSGVLMQAYPGSASTPWSGCGNVQWVISASNCAYLSNAGSWTNVSDVNRKHGFAAVRGEDVLARLRTMPITTWTYNADGDEVRHMGPTAQDFHAAFGLNGADNTHIATIDGDGVALAAAQALDARTRAQAETIAAQQRTIDAQGREIAELRAQLARIEAALTAKP